jgi:hypothetical protein
MLRQRPPALRALIVAGLGNPIAFYCFRLNTLPRLGGLQGASFEDPKFNKKRIEGEML